MDLAYTFSSQVHHWRTSGLFCVPFLLIWKKSSKTSLRKRVCALFYSSRRISIHQFRKIIAINKRHRKEQEGTGSWEIISFNSMHKENRENWRWHTSARLNHLNFQKFHQPLWTMCNTRDWGDCSHSNHHSSVMQTGTWRRNWGISVNCLLTLMLS